MLTYFVFTLVSLIGLSEFCMHAIRKHRAQTEAMYPELWSRPRLSGRELEVLSRLERAAPRRTRA